MTARAQWLTVLGVVAALAVALWAATHFLGDELFEVTVGTKAPTFAARTLDPEPATRSFDAYKGKVVLVNVWATWCAPCRQEMPSMEAMYKDFAPRGFKIVAVSIDDAGQEQKVRDFLQEFGITFDVLHDPTGAIQKTYMTTGVPENFLVGADGVIRKKSYTQDWNSETNRALVARLLDEAGAPPAATATIKPHTPTPVVERAGMSVEVVPDTAAATPPRAGARR
ncbi:alkyl hydroperoxide reductase/ Thiol specific antioxidant/ Mal allergen [Gemmatirosa kalamazoonensis]|uniref:Alkyl hydroperoxide reductase/ Thiol specific antioxidant/ Mal allergen n=1 Tax=Gemmatirosa kalamazoonensis TaxID=861299 RepID=W0RG64_9BACT|nr:TlpA disulfide reductase family protein [Gemmatirosa kalamazoonensis]AHG90099.1 alkyl hydroperoxide reductase/ Thiol specific antioxidant/ Mal allergen [Gemmatirosa kalamazoonensis]